MFALKEGVERSDHFIRLSPVRCIVDSKVLTYCAITKNPMMQRWHAFIQRYQLSFVHVASEQNIAADAVSRLLHTYLPSKSTATLRPSSVTVAPISPPVVISSDTSMTSPVEIAIVTRTGTTTVPLRDPAVLRLRLLCCPKRQSLKLSGAAVAKLQSQARTLRGKVIEAPRREASTRRRPGS